MVNSAELVRNHVLVCIRCANEDLNARGEKQQDVPIENQQPIVTTRPFPLAKSFFASGNGRAVTIDQQQIIR